MLPFKTKKFAEKWTGRHTDSVIMRSNCQNCSLKEILTLQIRVSLILHSLKKVVDALVGYIISPWECSAIVSVIISTCTGRHLCVGVCVCLSMRPQSKASHLETELPRRFINKYRLLASSNRTTITPDQASCTRSRPFLSFPFTLGDVQQPIDKTSPVPSCAPLKCTSDETRLHHTTKHHWTLIRYCSSSS